ncbi:hypothetical protein [Neisseria sp. Ec49-e6-T10]|uniref:hypothetical protein n=1 Tax=Neisseria sp. Ec49-e6-T10 TaxID=3140744 RepID=UPI003EB9EE1D
MGFISLRANTPAAFSISPKWISSADPDIGQKAVSIFANDKNIVSDTHNDKKAV